MGANAQTAVPAFTAGQVLTAAQQTQINTGIPVFATTVTRDAAFDGAGEKALAEGQFAYIEATNTTQYYDGAAWQSVGVSPGLVLVSSTTIGTTVSSVTVSSAFSSTYENYFVTITGGVASQTNYGRLTLGATATGYYKTLIYMAYNSNTVNGQGLQNQAYWDDIITGSTDNLNGAFYLFGPNLAKTTHFASFAAPAITTGQVTNNNMGYLSNSTQYTAFTLTAGVGTWTGGTVRVYGLANS